MKSVLFLPLCALLHFSLASSCSGGLRPSPSSESYIQIALSNNPNIKAARAKWEAMKKRVPQEKAWDDLMAGVDLQRTNTTRLDKVTDAEYMLSQALPISGKNLSRGRAAMAEALGAYEELRRTELDVVNRVQGAYYRLAGAYGQLEITKSNQALLKDLSEISRRKNEVGTAMQSDVLLAQTELARLSENVAMIQRDISDQESQLNVLMNHPANAPIATPSPLEFKSPAKSQSESLAIAEKLRPEILIALRQTEASKARLQLARRQWIPDPQLQIKARQFSGTSGIQEYDTGVFMSIPWANPVKYTAGVQEANGTLASSQHQLEAARVEVAGMVRDQFKKIETFASNYRLFHDQIMPTAQLAVKSTRAGYETDKNTFLELITAQRSMQEIESSALTQLVEHQAAIAELEALIGSTTYLPNPEHP